MPIAYFQLIPGNAASPGYGDAKELARHTVAQFGAVRGAGVGIAGGSCCAALAVTPNPGAGYPAAATMAGFAPAPPVVPMYGAALPFGIVFGNSQLAAGGLVPILVGGHAERAALTAAGAGGLVLYSPGNNAVLFVELAPCGPCQVWLGGGGGGVANPYNGVINGAGITTLNVWWRWPYPDGGGVAAMNAFHAQTLPIQLAQINGPTW